MKLKLFFYLNVKEKDKKEEDDGKKLEDGKTEKENDTENTTSINRYNFLNNYNKIFFFLFSYFRSYKNIITIIPIIFNKLFLMIVEIKYLIIICTLLAHRF